MKDVGKPLLLVKEIVIVPTYKWYRKQETNREIWRRNIVMRERWAESAGEWNIWGVWALECSGSASEGAGWLVKAIKGRPREYVEKGREDEILAMLIGNLRILCFWRCSDLKPWENLKPWARSTLASSGCHMRLFQRCLPTSATLLFCTFFPNLNYRNMGFFPLICPSIRGTYSFHWH